jgi:transposase
MTVQNRNYQGKKVFIGIDVHKKKYVVSAVFEGDVVKTWTTEAAPAKLKEQILKFFSGAEIGSAYEAGFSGFSLHRVLVAAGIVNKVVNAASIEVESNNRVKTDKQDSKKIAIQLSAGRLRGIYVPTEEEEARRSLSRGRTQAVDRRKRVANQLKMKLHYLGIIVPEGKKVCESFMLWAEGLKLSAEHKFAVAELISCWREETQRIKRFDRALMEQAKEDKLEETYQSTPGIGRVSSRILSNELGDLSRFDNERQLFSYTGLTPGEHSSGEKVRRGNISRCGPSRIRGLLIEVAWRAIEKDKGLQDLFRRVSRTRDSKRAIVAVARKMTGRIRKCFKEGVLWQDICSVSEAA